nr:hypothetical protein [uncultured Methanocorpusculum sp.]
MTRLDDFKKLVDGPGGVITFDRVNGSFTLAFTSGNFTEDGKGHGFLIRHPWGGSLYSIPGEVEVLREFDDETVDDFIQENVVVFDERVDIGRYLSYQPTYVPTKIEGVKSKMLERGSYYFVHNGYEYVLDKNGLDTQGAMEKYHTNFSMSGSRRSAQVSSFKAEDFDAFISEFTLDGTTVEDALAHQRGWRKLCDVGLFLSELWGEEYTGFYKGFWFAIDENGDYLYFIHEPPKLPAERLDITFGPFEDTSALFKMLHIDGEPFDEELLVNGFGDYNGLEIRIKENGKCISFVFDPVKLPAERIDMGFGPVERTGDLLKKTRINGKTFWDIYDTEYDDGEVLRGYY